MDNPLEAYAVENWGFPPGGDGDELLLLWQSKLKAFEVTEDKYLELVNALAKQVASAPTKAEIEASLSPEMRPIFAKLGEQRAKKTTKTTTSGNGLTAEELDAQVQRMVAHELKKKEANMSRIIDTDTDPVTPEMVFAPKKNQAAGRVDAKAPSAAYSNTRIVGKHAKTGQPVHTPDGKPAELSSQADKAKIGSYLKHLAFKQGMPIPPPDEHEKALFRELVATGKFCGQIGQEYVTDMSIKGTTLLEDTLSGGSYLNPYVFDNDIITFPLLNSELFPFVDLRDIPRGAEVRGASIKTPTATWSTAEGTSGTLFTTDGLVAQIDTIIHNIDVFIVVGLDTLADAAVDVATELTGLIGERVATELDKCIAIGDGTTQPQGIFAAPNVPVVVSQSHTHGPWTAKDTEDMIAGVAKQYRQNRNKPSIGWISNDGLYFRVRGIPVSSTDQRRIYGYDYEAYTMASRPWRIQNDIGPAEVAFGDLSRYRMWRRMGVQLDFSREGITLMQQNSAMLHARARFGGKLMDPNAFTICVDAGIN